MTGHRPLSELQACLLAGRANAMDVKAGVRLGYRCQFGHQQGWVVYKLRRFWWTTQNPAIPSAS